VISKTVSVPLLFIIFILLNLPYLITIYIKL